MIAALINIANALPEIIAAITQIVALFKQAENDLHRKQLADKLGGIELEKDPVQKSADLEATINDPPK